MTSLFKRDVLLTTLASWVVVFSVNLGGILLGYWRFGQSSAVAGFTVDWCLVGFTVSYYWHRWRFVGTTEEALDVDDPGESGSPDTNGRSL